MAFNLFCPLRQMRAESPETATKVIKAALPGYPIHILTEVELEFIPENHMELTGDKSAMDAIIRFEDEHGKKGFIAIETKYSENLGTNAAYDRDKDGNKTPRKQSLKAVQELNCFKSDVESRIINGEVRLTQIYRNFLLSEKFGHDEGLNSYSIILAPRNHPSTDNEFKSLYNELKEEHRTKINSMHLEDFVNAIINNSPTEYRVVFERFYDRYLNFEKLNNFD
jgi:hypothetical protein